MYNTNPKSLPPLSARIEAEQEKALSHLANLDDNAWFFSEEIREVQAVLRRLFELQEKLNESVAG